MSEPMPARREAAFSRTEMDAVFEMATSSSNSVGVAISRRRYPQQDNGMKCVGWYYQIEHYAYGYAQHLTFPHRKAPRR